MVVFVSYLDHFRIFFKKFILLKVPLTMARTHFQVSMALLHLLKHS